MAAVFPNGFAPMERFCIEQAFGKLRQIDNGSKYGHNAATQCQDKLELCSSVVPALVAKQFYSQAQTLRINVEDLKLESGGEDLPNAYRHVPCHPDDQPFAVIAVREPTTQAIYYQEVWGLIFGLAGSVLAFNRWPAS